MYEQGAYLGPKKTKKEDNKPSDSPYNQPQDNITSQTKISGKYCNLAYEMHIENRKILSPGGTAAKSNGGKALELRSTEALQGGWRVLKHAEWTENSESLTTTFDF